MAGEAVLGAFTQVVFDKAFRAAGQDLSLFWGIRGELTKLSSILRTIRSVLEDAEERQTRDAAVRDWLRRLKQLAYRAADILDRYEYDQLQPHGEAAGSLSCLSSSGVSIATKWRTARRIRAIRRDLDDIAAERRALGLHEGGSARGARLEVTERLATSSLVDGSCVFGREEDVENVVKLLLPNAPASGRAGVGVISIVGMGGLGKTTLAQLVYNHPRVSDQFKLRMWVCASDNFDVTKVTKEIAETATEANLDPDPGSARNLTATNTFTNLNLLQENLMSKLKGKRFLLVLDDVWNENLDKWQTLLSPLLYGGKGSKVLVTTRSVRVANIVGSSKQYLLRGLSEPECWQLFKKWAFVDGNSDPYPELEEIGKEIVKKLKGFPLAAKTLGNLLYSKLDISDWNIILRSEIWELPPDKNSILPALRLSYKHLPPHLKQCFAYCSVFHKDYVFQKEDLVKIWMALGFIDTSGRSLSMEDIGNEYFDDLLSRSFFQRHGDCEGVDYVMHDMFHDLAQMISVDECFRIEQFGKNRCYDPEKVRHLSFSSANSTPTSFEDFHRYQNLHTLLLLRGYKSPISHVPHDTFLKLRFLHVLKLSRRNITEIPSSIGTLKQLRYLSIAGSSTKKLPSSVTRLYNLLTLKLEGCVLLESLPRGMSNLRNLRHLVATPELISTINGIGYLTSLQKLDEYFVLTEDGHGIGELKNMMELHGKLCIQNLENVRSKAEAIQSRLLEKANLIALELNWAESRSVGPESSFLEETVLECLQPHSNLKELKIKNYGGLDFPCWFRNVPLLSMQSISLINCRKCQRLPPLGRLPFLKFLLIEGIDGVKSIGDELYGEVENAIEGFPSLEELVLLDMTILEEWQGQQAGNYFPCLREIQVEDCSLLRGLPSMPPTLTKFRISDLGISSLPEIGGGGLREEQIPIIIAGEPSQALISSLYISNCSKLSSLGQGLLSQQLDHLEDLTISDCDALLSLPTTGFRVFTSLRVLHIYNCPNLSRCTEDMIFPSSLEDIRIRACSTFVNAHLLSQLGSLATIRHFEIASCDKLVSFPEKGLPMNLDFLGVFNCRNLQSLPPNLNSLSSLKTLTISNCPILSYLPPGGLPSSMHELYINKCPQLKEKYQKRGGLYWNVISHIPYVDFDEESNLFKVRQLKNR